MTSYSIQYYIKRDESMTLFIEQVDAKDLRSAKRKIEVRLAKRINKERCPSRQIKHVQIKIIRFTIIGYY